MHPLRALRCAAPRPLSRLLAVAALVLGSPACSTGELKVSEWCEQTATRYCDRCAEGYTGCQAEYEQRCRGEREPTAKTGLFKGDRDRCFEEMGAATCIAMRAVGPSGRCKLR
jgi:hypothetical protein